jgi:hypothetical protein
MSDSEDTIEIIADALIRQEGSRKAAIAEAANRARTTKVDKAEWQQVYCLLASGKHIPLHKAKLPGITNPHEVHYERVESKPMEDVWVGLADNGDTPFQCGTCEYFADGHCHHKHPKLNGRPVAEKWCCNLYDHKGMKRIIPDDNEPEKFASGGSVLNQIGQHDPGLRPRRWRE